MLAQARLSVIMDCSAIIQDPISPMLAFAEGNKLLKVKS
jgi:hypothetical protein